MDQHGDGISLNVSLVSSDFLLADITAIMRHFDTVVVQKSYKPYGGFNFNYLFITSVCLLLISHVVTALYWATHLKNNTKVTFYGVYDLFTPLPELRNVTDMAD